MKTYHLFISHSWSYSDQYDNLVHLLNQAPDFAYQNRSIPKNDPVHSSTDRELSAAIHNHMASCGIVLVLAGVYASCSKWIDKEIKIAKSSWLVPKPVLAIEPFGSQRTSQMSNLSRMRLSIGARVALWRPSKDWLERHVRSQQ